MTLQYILSKDADQIYPYLSDMQKFKEVHPVIYQVDRLGEREYLFYERMTVLFIPVRFTYKVSITKTEENKMVCMYSRVQRGVYLHLDFELEQKTDSTLVKETIEIKAWPGVKQVFASILKKAHHRFFENLRAIE